MTKEILKLRHLSLACSAAALLFAYLLSTDALLTTASVETGPAFTPWGPPENLGCVVNSISNDSGAAISKDGLSLYFLSDRPGGSGSTDIWVSQRESVDDPWDPPTNLGPNVNSPSQDVVPALSRDEHWLFITSNRPGGFGSFDVWASWRSHIHDDFGWETPVNLGPGINTSGFDAGASYFENEEGGPPLLFFGRGLVPVQDIYVSELQPDGVFGPGVPVGELNSPASDRRASIRFDGLEMLLFSNRAGSLGGNDLWSSTRGRFFDAWEPPTNLGPTVNTTLNEEHPYLSPDRTTLLFGSDRPGGCGSFDLWMTTRRKINKGRGAE